MNLSSPLLRKLYKNWETKHNVTVETQLFFNYVKLKSTKNGGVVALLASTLSVSPSAQALTYRASFDSTVSSSNVGNVNVGNPVRLSVDLDNGGVSLANQTWTSPNVTSVTFDFGNGTNKTVFNPNGGNGFSSFSGSYATNGSGQLTSVASLFDFSQVNVISTNSPSKPIQWYINGFNGVFFTTTPSGSVSINNVGNNIIASNWSIAPATPVPFEFSPALGVGVLGGLWAGKRFLKSRKTK